MRRRDRLTLWVVRLAPLIVVLPLLLEAGEALARVGGGQSYGGRSTGGSRGGGSYGGGGGGGSDGDLIYLLLWLLIRYPALGIPLLIVGVVALVMRARMQGAGPMPVPRREPVVRGVAGLAALRRADPGFSMPVLLDLLVLVYRRAYEAQRTGAWGPLDPYVAPSARTGIAASAGGAEIVEVIPGSVTVLQAEQREGRQRLTARFEVSRLERTPAGERRFIVVEVWDFARDAGATTRAPDEVQRLGCPSCGVSIEGTVQGACPNCGTAIGAGQLEWQAVRVERRDREPARSPELGFFDGGDEPSVRAPTARDPNLPAAVRALHGRHPDFTDAGFTTRVREVFLRLQAAWSAGKWDDARPYVTDPLYQTLRFQMERYAASGLRNALDDVALDKLVLSAVEVDAWYESITVRLWAQCRDYVVDGSGKVVGGNARQARRFSEYWTFVRASGTGGGSKDSRLCPSCGAPIDRINAAGVCGYCGSKITTGRFDWVLSRIEQVDARS